MNISDNSVMSVKVGRISTVGQPIMQHLHQPIRALVSEQDKVYVSQGFQNILK